MIQESSESLEGRGNGTKERPRIDPVTVVLFLHTHGTAEDTKIENPIVGRHENRTEPAFQGKLITIETERTIEASLFEIGKIFLHNYI